MICRKFTLLLLISGLFLSAQAQQGTKSPAGGEKKVVRINTSKPDTNKSTQKALNKFSQESMFQTNPTERAKTPEEKQAFEYYKNGFYKGKAGDYNAAIIEFTKSLELNKNEDALMKRSASFMMTGAYGAAIVDATEALKLKPTAYDAYFIRGVCRYESGDFSGSKEDLTFFIQKKRTNAVAFNYMAAHQFMEKDYKSALESYNEVVRLDPNYPDIYTNRGMMRHYNGDYKGAIEDYGEALKRNQDNATAYNNRGAAYLMVKEFQLALDDFNKAIALEPENPNAYDNRGRTRLALGELDAACADWRVAVSKGLAASKQLIELYCH